MPYRYWRPEPLLPSLSDQTRFWSYVCRGASAECWPWRTGKQAIFWWRDDVGHRQHQKASRLAYRLATGEIPADRIIAHSCDNPPCCNPQHLTAETQQKNSMDMAGRGLHPYMASEGFRSTRSSWWSHGANGPGEANGAAKLTDGQVREIRTRYAAGTARQVDLAFEFGVGQTTISRVLRRESWSHL